jgi:hypothetical protein
VPGTDADTGAGAGVGVGVGAGLVLGWAGLGWCWQRPFGFGGVRITFHCSVHQTLFTSLHISHLEREREGGGRGERGRIPSHPSPTICSSPRAHPPRMAEVKKTPFLRPDRHMGEEKGRELGFAHRNKKKDRHTYHL